ncbi:MAG: hypothetical protein WBP61_19560 [Nocardioides sp.]
MATLRLLLAGLIAALGLVALSAAPSHACSCAMGGPKDYVRWSDVVFTGTLDEIVESPPDPDGTVSSVDPTTYRFDVDRVLEGEVGATADVTSARFGASCGLEGMRVGTPYVVFAAVDGGRLQASLCGGTQPERAGFVDRVERVTGPAEPVGDDGGGTIGDIAAIVAAILAIFGLGT